MNDYSQDINSIYGQAKLAGAASLNAVKETPLTRLQYAVERLRKSDAIVSEAANRLVGERGPEINGTGQARAPVGSGFLGHIEELADNVSDLANSILDNIQRIERRL
ncbi:MAG TPA: hypothetical protein VFG14_14605 [Chthoniobacteraceae bacterium]|jgi:hypothetical protein|nr:hypothetical protein [Chthoniobacteraceae bacterium]